MGTIGEQLLAYCIRTSLPLGKLRQLHAVLFASGLAVGCALSPHINNNILSKYGRRGSLVDAQKLFDKMPSRSIVSYNAMIAAYSKCHCCQNLAFTLFNRMQAHHLRPNEITFTSLLRACCLSGGWLLGSAVHAQVVKIGALGDTCLQTSLLGMYSNCGDLESAHAVFVRMGQKDAVSWNSMISGNLKNEKIKRGLELFYEMVKSDVPPTHFTYSMVLNGCSKIGGYIFGKIIHARVLVLNTQADLHLQNCLLDMYCNCSDTKNALSVFTRIKNPDLVSWNSMISGFSESGEAGQAMNLFTQLSALSFLGPDEYTYATIISTCKDSAYANYGKPLHGQVIKTGVDGSFYIASNLLSMYFKNQEAEYAQNLFDLTITKDVVLWTEMIIGHSRLGDAGNAMCSFRSMSQEGHKCDGFALSGALSVCADFASSKQGEMIHTHVIKTGHETNMCVNGSMIDMYAKSGNLLAARSIFSQVLYPDLKCWNSMLGGYSQHGMANEAFALFGDILSLGQEPDEVSYLTVLSACSHRGMVEEGRFLWKHMVAHGNTPKYKHYSCMISLLSRAGLLQEAEELIIKSSNIEEQSEQWRILLSFCVEKKSFEIGVRAAEQVLLLCPGDGPTHILLSNLYALEGRWDGVSGLRRKIRGSALGRDPGLSWVESGGGVFVFSSGNHSCPGVVEAQDEVHRLRGNMMGTSLDVFWGWGHLHG